MEEQKIKIENLRVVKKLKEANEDSNHVEHFLEIVKVKINGRKTCPECGCNRFIRSGEVPPGLEEVHCAACGFQIKKP